jgi:histidyl-tRNA synthetase
MSNKTQPARGMRDFLPSDVRKRNYVIGIIKEVYEKYGFEPLETPAVENLETLTGKYGEEGGQLMFKILKRGEKLNVSAGEKGLSDLALRYDLTVPLARVVANYKNDLPRFFKRYQIQPVWRADRPARGRYREFYQCDVDAIGSSSMIVEAELISAVCEILQRLGFDDFVVKLNHRKILEGCLEQFAIPKEKYADVLVAIDKLDKIGVDGVYRELISKGIDDDVVANLETFFNPEWKRIYKTEKAKEKASPSRNYKILDSLKGLIIKDNIIGTEGFNELKTLISLTSNTVASSHILFDNTLARGLSYYTGAIFEINVPDLAGSLGGGGRYDGLIGMFGKEQIPACGFSLGLERILVVMDERGMFPDELQRASADVMVTIWDENSIGESLKLANELREKGLRVLVYPEADKLGKQFKYAGQINIPFVCVLGEAELAENKVTLKNMQTGEQEIVERENILEKISA